MTELIHVKYETMEKNREITLQGRNISDQTKHILFNISVFIRSYLGRSAWCLVIIAYRIFVVVLFIYCYTRL